MCSLTFQIRNDRIQPASQHKRPHRLVAQDEALSRLKPGFEFPWGHKKRTASMSNSFCYSYPDYRTLLFTSITPSGFNT